jgi:hypothetical protein
MRVSGLARLAFPLVVVLGVAADPAPAPQAGAAKPSQPFPPADARRAPGGKDTPDVLSLLRQRRDVVKAELEQARKYLVDPNFRADVWAALAERLLVAETDVAETPAERVAAYRNFRDNLKVLENQLQRVPEPFRGQGVFEYGQKLWIHNRRLQAEVSLLRAELAKGETPPADDPPAVRTAILTWREAVRQWAKMWLDSKISLIAPFAREIASTVLEADLAAAGNAAERLAAYQAYRDRLADIEKEAKSDFEKRRYDVMNYLRTKELRCEADVVLGRMKAGDGKTLDKDPPEVRAALDDWVQTIGFEAEVIRKRYEPRKVPPEESLPVDESVLHEELAAAAKPEERVAAYRKFLGKLKDAEATLKARPGTDPVVKEDATRSTFNRAAAELTLLQLSAAPATAPAPAAKALLREEHDALGTQFGMRAAEWAAGSGDFQALQENAGRLLLVELDMADTPAERLAAYQTHAERIRSAEAQCKALVDAKKGSDTWLLWTRGARLEADIWLLRAGKNLAAPSAVTPAGPR